MLPPMVTPMAMLVTMPSTWPELLMAEIPTFPTKWPEIMISRHAVERLQQADGNHGQGIPGQLPPDAFRRSGYVP